MQTPLGFPMVSHTCAAVSCAIIGTVLIRNRAAAIRLLFDNRVALGRVVALFGVVHLGALAADLCHARIVASFLMAGFWLVTLPAAVRVLAEIRRRRPRK